ncbi:MAG: GntR family transcriptional regulator, partial [Pseudomonadota bacterium]
MTADQAADDEQTGLQTGFIGQGERAYEGLLDLVLSKEIAPGEAVTERRLALRLGLSRTPIREALHRLEGEGLLERRDGKHHVRGLTVEDVMEALHVRSLLETDAARRAAGRIPHRALSELRGRLVILQQGADPGVPDHRATDEDLHGLIASHSGNQLLAEMITGLR